MAKQQPARPMAQPGAAKTTAPAQPQAAPRTAAPANRTTGGGTAYRFTPSEEQIRMRAYEKWQAAGCPTGDGCNFWYEAERELREGR